MHDKSRIAAAIRGLLWMKMTMGNSGLKGLPFVCVQIIESGTHYILEISNGLVTDSGRFVCLATNSEGRARAATSLLVNKLQKSTEGDKPDFRAVLRAK